MVQSKHETPDYIPPEYGEEPQPSDLATGTLDYRTVWSLAGPNVISNILMVSVSFAQLALVAPLGASATAAVVTGSRIQFFMMALALALSVSTTAVVARAWGAGDRQQAATALAASVTLGTGMALVMAVLVYSTASMTVGLFGLDPNTSGDAEDYVRLSALINLVPTLFIILTAGFRATGKVVMPLWVTAVSTTVSIAASALFLYLDWGVIGVVYGSFVGQTLALILLLIAWVNRSSGLAPRFGGWTNKEIMGSLLRIGAPSALEQLLIQASFILYMVLIARYGTEAFAAYGIGITILSVTIVVGLGFGTASSALTGQSLGANLPERARQSGWAAARLAVGLMTILAVLTWAGGDLLADILTTDPLVRDYTIAFILILAVVQPPMAVEFAIGGGLRGAGDTRFPLIVTFCGNILARFGLGVLVVTLDLGVIWLYSVIIVDYAVKSMLLVLRFRGDAWITAIKEGGSATPAALPSLAGVSRAALRAFYSRRKD